MSYPVFSNLLISLQIHNGIPARANTHPCKKTGNFSFNLFQSDNKKSPPKGGLFLFGAVVQSEELSPLMPRVEQHVLPDVSSSCAMLSAGSF
jgi:hypothetical protein